MLSVFWGPSRRLEQHENLRGDPSRGLAEAGFAFGKLQKKAPYALKSLDAELKSPLGLPNSLVGHDRKGIIGRCR
jgi:hypothetical protein